ncbi:MAG: hypothetical protein ACRCW4_13380 [Candidatus Neomicrothrix subdominans]
MGISCTVHVLDGLDRVAEIADFERVVAIENDLGLGSIRVEGIGNKAVIRALSRMHETGERAGLEIHEAGSGWRLAGPGQVMAETHGRDGLTSITFQCTDQMRWLDATLDWPDSATLSSWWATTNWTLQRSEAVESLIEWNLGNLVPGIYAYRRPPNFVPIDPPVPFGPAINYQATNRSLLETIRPWFEGTDATFRLGLDRSGPAPELRFAAALRGVSPQEVRADTQGGIEIVRTAAEATWVIGMGRQPDPNLDPREVALAHGPETSWLTLHREASISRPSAPNLATLQSEVDQELRRLGPKVAVTVPEFELPGYGSHTRIGDYVRVIVGPEQPALLVPITSTRTECDESGWRRLVSVGRDVRIDGPNGAAALMDKFKTLMSTIKRVEREVTY